MRRTESANATSPGRLAGASANAPPGPARLRICTLAACPFPANHGTPGSIREMAEAIAELGHEVHVVTYHMGERIPLQQVQLHRITPLTKEAQVVVGPTVRRPLYDLQMVFKALQVIHRHRPHVLHAHGYEAALVAYCCRLATGLPVVYSGHNTMTDELASYKFIRPRFLADGLAWVLDGLVPRIGNRCVPHSTNIEKFLHGMGLRGRCEPVVNFGIDTRIMANGDGAGVRRQYDLGDAPVIVYAGVLDEFQRIDLLLQALVRVLWCEPGAKLLMVVTIPQEGHIARIRRQAEELGVSKSIVWTAPQPLETVRHCLAAADVAVVPRPHAPGFPIKLLNYMAARRPCILYGSSASHGLTHLDTVYLARPDTGEALGDGILELLRDAELRRRLARNGYRFVRDNHDRRIIAQRLCETYYRTLGFSSPQAGENRKSELKIAGAFQRVEEATRNGTEPQRDESSEEVLCDVGA